MKSSAAVGGWKPDRQRRAAQRLSEQTGSTVDHSIGDPQWIIASVIHSGS